VKNNTKFYSFCLFGTTLLNLISPSLGATEIKENTVSKNRDVSELISTEVKLDNTIAETIENSLSQNSSDSPNLFLDKNSFNTFTSSNNNLLAQLPTTDGSNSNTPTFPTNYKPSNNPVTPTPSNLAPLNPNPIIPSPTININGSYVPASGVVPPTAPPPPYLPRAVPPPVGDISISNIDAATGNIDLGTGGSNRITGLVLKDAPAREVLELLARSAGLNLAFYSGNSAEQQGQPGVTSPSGGPPISLNIQDESAQDVFNYVLMLSGLQANRVGRTIFVGTQLPAGARQLISRTLRMNQVTVGQAVGFLVSQGAEQQQVTTQTQVTIVGEGPGAQRITNTSTSVSRIAAQPEIPVPGQNFGPSAALLLRGVLVTPDERLNAVTLIGEPRKIEIASALLTQLDLRRRQVAVNVKIVDVNLSKTDDINTSFSFGIGEAVFLNFAGGRATVNSNPSNVRRGFIGELTAQIENGNAKILTDPTVIVQEGERTKVNLTQEVVGGFQTDFVQVGNVVQPQRRPIIKEAGLILDIQVPRIDDNGFVTLAVAPTVSAPGRTVQDGDGAITLLQKRELQSGQIRLRDGQTLILSGIIQESDTVDITKVPILGDIPILGALFRRTNRTNQRQEVIVILTPQIIDDTSGKGSFGYGYTPGNDARQQLERRNFPVPNR
jgi:type IV pilus assembly protein PilQ